MLIQYASDLHLEFRHNVRFLEANPIIPRSKILILAGDIALLGKSLPLRQFGILSDSFESVFWLPGNHEYYHGDMENARDVDPSRLPDNFRIVDNESVDIGDLRLVFSTLWGEISPRNEAAVRSGVSDFEAISVGDESFQPGHFNALHEAAKRSIEAGLRDAQNGQSPQGAPDTPARPEKRCVVVTHHVPTLVRYPACYAGSPLNEAFVVEMDDFIHKYRPLAWIYGHSHRNVPEFRIGETRMLTNQLGYVQFGENAGFRRDAVVDVNADVEEDWEARTRDGPALAENRIGHDPPVGSVWLGLSFRNPG
jgi:Icc-related predicted phosphoesterase